MKLEWGLCRCAIASHLPRTTWSIPIHTTKSVTNWKSNNHWFNPQFLPSADLSISSSSSSSLSCTSSNLSISPSDCPKWVSSSSSNLYFPCRSWWCYVIILHLSYFMFFNYFHESQTNVLLRKVCVINSMNIVVLYLLYMYIAVICWNVAHKW